MALQYIPGRAISLTSQAAGDVAYYNGTEWIRLAKGTAGQQLAINSGATAPEWTTPGIGETHLVQVVTVQDGGLKTVTAIIPADDTIPQISEGTNILQVVITPKSATNRLFITGQVIVHSAQTDHIIALFQDSTVNALATANQRGASTGEQETISIMWNGVAGTTSASTFHIRYGASGVGTYYVNGDTSGREFGGSFATTMNILEYSV